MDEYIFNVDNGYLEGLVRGFRSGILSRGDYLNLVQCETVEGEPYPTLAVWVNIHTILLLTFVYM